MGKFGGRKGLEHEDMKEIISRWITMSFSTIKLWMWQICDVKHLYHGGYYLYILLILILIISSFCPHRILSAKIDYSSKQYQYIGLCNEEIVCFCEVET